jgi:hypothetical protein
MESFAIILTGFVKMKQGKIKFWGAQRGAIKYYLA